jgi:hypothetical protein
MTTHTHGGPGVVTLLPASIAFEHHEMVALHFLVSGKAMRAGRAFAAATDRRALA